MKRRDMMAGFVAGVGFTVGNGYLWQLAENTYSPSQAVSEDEIMVDEEIIASFEEGIYSPKNPLAELGDTLKSAIEKVVEEVVESETPTILTNADDLLDRVRHFEREFADDIYLPESERPILHSVILRFQQAEKTVGHGNYNLLSFDELFKYAERFSNIGQFTKPEFDMIERLFFTEAAKYGFHGEKVTTELTARVNRDETFKVPRSGHFLLRGDSLNHYQQLERDIGDTVILTSGVRANVKQMHLFVAKCIESNYNMSMASRSLAPPGHSYHGIGDFDVGRVGWGYANFTDEFANTDEYKRMQDLGYVRIRYTEDNRFGVRFEPWHIKVA